jgi:hypothetical protein
MEIYMNNKQFAFKRELLGNIDKSWKTFDKFINKLSEKQLTEVVDLQGWSIKDHIIHLTRWERSVEYFLQKRPRYSGLGISKELSDSGDIDEINKVIYLQGKNTTLSEALAEFRSCHDSVIKLILSCTDDELKEPYNQFILDEPEDDRKAYEVIYSNTSGHLEEHIEWISKLVNK